MLRVANLAKEFYFYRTPWHRLLEALSGGAIPRAHVFPALHDVSFDLARGRSLGVVGVNGAGKSTLLKLVAGTLHPTSGSIEIDGRVAALLELGTGFHPDLTGRQNARMNARFLGLAAGEVDERIESIERFSELGDFFDRPLRVYSSGMVLRLGFSVAANVEADLLIVDEALAVGDVGFQQKCVRHIRELPQRGVATLIVSHDLAAVKTLCDEAILLHAGTIAEHGKPDRVIERYNALIAGRFEDIRDSTGDRPRSFGGGAAQITRVAIRDRDGRPLQTLDPGQPVEIRVEVAFHAPLDHPTIGMLIRDRLGNDAFGTNTFHHAIDTGTFAPGDNVSCSFFLAAELGAGDYTICATVHDGATHDQGCHDWVDGALLFRVKPPAREHFVGTAFLHARIAVQRGRNGAG